MTNAEREFERWLESQNTTKEEKNELYAIRNNKAEIASRFTSPMSFGTAGLRSVMGSGISRMNVHTVAQATKGVAEIVIAAGGMDKGVAIAYDSRNNSALFADTASCVLASKGIKVYLFDNIRPTPELSFAVLHFGCMAGINITASHNTKEYNGYKVYWSDGAQLPPEHASKVASAMAKTDVLDAFDCDKSKFVKEGLINIIGNEIDEKYIECVLSCRINKEVIPKYGNSLALVYTPLHGTGYKLVPEVIRRAGITNLVSVPEQTVIDGSFPTVKSPNPENSDCFEKAIEYIKSNNLPTNVIIATDPDGDRLGVALKQSDGSFAPLSGNQIGAVLVDYIIKSRKAAGKLPKNSCAVRSAVSSTLFDKICLANGVTPVTVLTGFKYIGEKIKEYAKSGEYTFIFGYEESQGFLSGGYVRDKDGVAASLLVAEAAAYYAGMGKTLGTVLEEIYTVYGLHAEKTVSISFDGVMPMDDMKAKMTSLRHEKAEEFGNEKVVVFGDCQSQIETDMTNGTAKSTGLPKADMLYYKTSKGTTVIIRPSGTEPKVKAYILVSADSKAQANDKISTIESQIQNIFKA